MPTIRRSTSHCVKPSSRRCSEILRASGDGNLLSIHWALATTYSSCCKCYTKCRLFVIFDSILFFIALDSTSFFTKLRARCAYASIVSHKSMRTRIRDCSSKTSSTWTTRSSSILKSTRSTTLSRTNSIWLGSASKTRPTICSIFVRTCLSLISKTSSWSGPASTLTSWG